MDEHQFPANEPVEPDAEDLLTHALFGADTDAQDAPTDAPAPESNAGADASGSAQIPASYSETGLSNEAAPHAPDANGRPFGGAFDVLAGGDPETEGFTPPDPADRDGDFGEDAFDDDAADEPPIPSGASGAPAGFAPTSGSAPREAVPPPPQRRVEPFVPTEAFYPTQPPRKRKRRRKRSSLLWLLPVLLGIGLLLGGLYIYKVRYNPSSFFGTQSAKATPVPAVIAATPLQQDAQLQPEATPAPTPTLDPYAALMQQADASMMQNIVNILIIGVDYAEERETWGGKKEWHSDVMMVLAVNFDEKRADLISLPRDTYAKIPGVKGVYKLNAAINCGGGMDAPGGAGFLKVCEAASWMLGGIPVDYYYAVTMPAVKGLVDAVGGVDYDLEMSYTMMSRRYYKGQQHMDGQAVLDYLRVRKNISKSGDVNRVNRQKRMMVALFDSMQQQNLILKIPDLISSFDGQLFTNCTLSQTAALASFAYDLDKENIGMYSMTSKNGGNTNIFNWNFCLTDQPKRVQIIKTVYGIDVPQEREYTPAFARYRWAEMRADRCESTGGKVRDYAADCIANGTLDVDGVMPGVDGGYTDPGLGGGDWGEPPEDGLTNGIPDAGAVGARAVLVPSAIALLRPSGLSSRVLGYSSADVQLYNSLKSMLDDLPDVRAKAARDTANYSAGKRDSFPDSANSLINMVDSIQNTATQLAGNLGYGGNLSWGVRYEKDRSFNEVAVDFN